MLPTSTFACFQGSTMESTSVPQCQSGMLEEFQGDWDEWHEKGIMPYSLIFLLLLA